MIIVATIHETANAGHRGVNSEASQDSITLNPRRNGLYVDIESNVIGENRREGFIRLSAGAAEVLGEQLIELSRRSG